MARIASPTFIGRTAELAELDAAFEAALQGNPTTVLIGGDAGVGKTRLLATWNERAVGRGARVVSGACLDLGESGPAYVAVLGALRDLLGSLDPAALDEVVGSDRRTLARILPELAEDAEAGTGDAGLTPTAQTRLFHALVRVLERASSDRPLVLELEDIHWADPSTRAFLVYLVANARAARLLVVATVRAEETGRGHPISSVLLELERHHDPRTIELLPFDVDELGEQLRGILGEAPSPKLLAAINVRSEGNALFAEELVASSDPAAELPASIGAALLSRTAALSPGAQVALRVGSVAGRSTSYEVLRSATELDVDRLDAALREAVDANILEAEHVGERYGFRHALLQEAIYRDTLPGERRRLHASVAAAMEEHPDRHVDDPELASQLAYHWFEAKEPDRAFKASLEAADAAVHQAAYAEALDHYERVLDLWDQAPRSRVDRRQAVVLERASRVALLSGDDQKTVMYARRALGAIDAEDDQVLRVRVLDQIARALHNLMDDAIEYELRLGAVELEGLPEREQLVVLDSRIEVHRRNGDSAAATIAALEALRLADDSDDPELIGDAHLILAWNLMETLDMDGAIREARVAQEFASLAGDAETEFAARRMLAGAYVQSGRYELAISAAQTARAYAEQVGLSHWEGQWPSLFEAEALFELGQIEDSSQVIAVALIDLPAGWTFRVLHLLAARISTVQASFDDARAHLEAARIPNATVEEEDIRGVLATARAELAISEGRFEDVRSIVRTTARALLRLPVFADSEMVWPLVEIGLDAEATRAEIGRAAGDVSAIEATQAVAATLLGFIADARRDRDAAGVRDFGMQRGDEALIEGHLARIEDRDDPSLWVAAAQLFPPRSPRGLTARYRQAEAMLATRAPRDEIRAVMADAHATAVEIGAAPLARRFEALARRARIDLRPAASAATSDDAEPVPDEPPPPWTVALRGRGLSDREIEVLTLVSAGFSNQAIGDRLFITDKTASVHVSHILAKLGASSRTEAATIGVRLGLPDVERDDGAD